MKTKLIGILAITILFTSCSKNDDLTVTLKTDGILSVQVTDNAGLFISNTKVKLYDANLTDDYLAALKTDVSGSVYFGEVISGSYTLAVDTPKVSGIKYMPIKRIQVISGLYKNVTINVQEYVGTLKLTFKKASYLGGGPFSGLNVILVPNNLFSPSDAIATLIKKAEFSGKTDAQGGVSFTIPSSREFRLIVYNEKKTRKNSLITLDLIKDELSKLSYSLDTSLYSMRK